MPRKNFLKTGYTKTKRAIEITSFVIAGILFPIACWNTFRFASLLSWGVGTLGLILGVIFADFMSGVVHWAADTWGSLEVPLVGNTFIRSFREHHLAPTAMCDHDVIETNGDTVMLTIPVLLLVSLKDMIAHSPDGIVAAHSDVFRSAFWLTTCIGVTFTNQFHKWAHMNKLPPMVEFLQSYWIILPKRIHNIHHRPPFDSNYCITNGWLNPLLNAFGFWRHAERVITFITGWIPREDDYKWTGLAPGVPDVVAKFLKAKREASEKKA